MNKDCQCKKHLSAEVAEFIERHTWPGNIRELRNVLLYADAIGEESKEVATYELPEEYQSCRGILVQTHESAPKHTTSGRLLDQASQDLINQVVEDCKGNISQAAKKLGISRATLYRKLAKERDTTALN